MKSVKAVSTNKLAIAQPAAGPSPPPPLPPVFVCLPVPLLPAACHIICLLSRKWISWTIMTARQAGRRVGRRADGQTGRQAGLDVCVHSLTLIAIWRPLGFEWAWQRANLCQMWPNLLANILQCSYRLSSQSESQHENEIRFASEFTVGQGRCMCVLGGRSTVPWGQRWVHWLTLDSQAGNAIALHLPQAQSERHRQRQQLAAHFLWLSRWNKFMKCLLQQKYKLCVIKHTTWPSSIIILNLIIFISIGLILKVDAAQRIRGLSIL